MSTPTLFQGPDQSFCLFGHRLPRTDTSRKPGACPACANRRASDIVNGTPSHVWASLADNEDACGRVPRDPLWNPHSTPPSEETSASD